MTLTYRAKIINLGYGKRMAAFQTLCIAWWSYNFKRSILKHSAFDGLLPGKIEGRHFDATQLTNDKLYAVKMPDTRLCSFLVGNVDNAHGDGQLMHTSGPSGF